LPDDFDLKEFVSVLSRIKLIAMKILLEVLLKERILAHGDARG
jgi:hypothetical protein